MAPPNSLVFTNARIFDGVSPELTRGAVRVVGDTIEQVGPQVATDDAEIVDCGGRVLIPGLNAGVAPFARGQSRRDKPRNSERRSAPGKRSGAAPACAARAWGDGAPKPARA